MKTENKKIPIIIDTDPGHDDALAILLLEKSGLFDIKAITTVAGNSNIQNVTNNARYVLDLVQSKSPIYSGSGKPLRRELVQAVVHGKGGLAGADIKRKEKLNNQAVQKLISIVKDNPSEISIVVIGPQTNIAKAFLKEPGLPKLIKQLVIMGGAISVPGNKNRVAEFNIFVDPESAEIVFNADVKKVLVPLDVCNDIKLYEKDFERLKGGKLYKPINKMMGYYISGLMKGEKIRGALMYDVLAAYYLINSKAYKSKKMDIRIETKGTLARGMTVVEKRTWGDKVPNVEVITQVDGEKFRRDFLSILQGVKIKQ